MLDLPVLSVSLLFLLFVSLTSFSMYATRVKEVAADGFFFANRNSNWLPLGASFMTTWLSGLYAVAVMVGGMGVTWTIIYGIGSAAMLVVLGWFIGPLFLRMRISTIPEYFERRFSRGCRLFLSSLNIFCNIFIRLLVVLVVGSTLINRIASVDPFTPLLLFLFAAGVYVIVGGLRAEVYASIVQGLVIMIVVAAFAQWLVSQAHGGNTVLHRTGSFSALTAASRPSRTWAGSAVGLFIMCFWFWCADQFIVQKVVSVHSVSSLRKSAGLHGFLQLIPVCIIALSGLTLAPGLLNEHSIYAVLAGNSIPPVLRFGLIAAVACALMALFASILNSTSLMITFDFYRSLRPGASDRTLLLVGRISTIILLLCSMLIIPVAQTVDFNLCVKLVRGFVYLASLVAAVLIVSLLSARIRTASAMLTLHSVSAVILLRAGAEILYGDRPFGNAALDIFARSMPLEFSAFVFLLSIFLLFGFQELGIVRPAALQIRRTMRELFRKLGRYNLRKTMPQRQ